MLSSNDNAHVVDLKNNKITNTGCRGLAALLRTTETIEEIDLSGNMISRPGIRTLAEALENNTRVKHVFVHDNGKIEALGTITEADASTKENGDQAEGGKTNSFEGEEGMEPIDTGYVDTILTIIVEKQNPEPRYPVGEVKREPGEHDDEEHNKELPGDKKDHPEKFETPLSKRIKHLEKHLGPRANAVTTSDQAEMIAILEAEKWATRAENIGKSKVLRPFLQIT